MHKIAILIPTCNRLPALCVTLTSLYYQFEKDFEIIISDQSSRYNIENDPLLQALIRLHETAGNPVRIFKNLPFKGMAEQRNFLLQHVQSTYSLFLDDDLILEPYVIRNLLLVIERQDCGFTGNAVLGLSFADDVRPLQQKIELWNEQVKPETIVPGSDEWNRYQLHNAANLLHVQRQYVANPNNPMAYKIAWVGGCVLYNTSKLKTAGGFDFWQQLPIAHCGEDVTAQLNVMKAFGGCGVMPSGVYHQELETTVQDRSINAPEYLNSAYAE